jgi:hypothetical protein
METLLLVLDLAGTFVFAISGAMAGVKHRLDLFGVLVLSFVAANTGGMARDVLIGAVPPPALSDWRYLAVSLLAGVITFFCYAAVDRLRSPVLMFDAAGLALFAVAGAQKAVALAWKRRPKPSASQPPPPTATGIMLAFGSMASCWAMGNDSIYRRMFSGSVATCRPIAAYSLIFFAGP